MRGAAERGHLVLGLGDFNMLPLSLAHRLISTHAPVKDTWRVLHPESSIGAAVDPVEMARERPIPSADYNVLENGATCDGVFNTWRWNKGQQERLGPGKPAIEIAGNTMDPKAKRLDYIFASNGESHNGGGGGWIVHSSKVGMIERHPTLQCSLSDHFSVETRLVWQSADIQQKDEELIVNGNVYPPSQTTLEHSHTNAPFIDSTGYLPVETYDEILAMIAKYTMRERQQRRLRLSHFVLSVLVSVGCFVAIWFSPRNFVAFLLNLLSTLGLGAGIIDGLIGGLFVGSEIRALKEFEWEIRNARMAAGAAEVEGEREALEGVVDW